MLLLAVMPGISLMNNAAMAQTFSNEKVYNLKTARGFLLYNPDYNTICASSASGFKAPAASKTDINQQFALISNGSTVFLYSVGAKKFVETDGKYSRNPKAAIRFKASTYTAYPQQLFIGSQCVNVQEASDKVKTGVKVDTWTTQDKGNCFNIAEATMDSTTDLSQAIAAVKALKTDFNDLVGHYFWIKPKGRSAEYLRAGNLAADAYTSADGQLRMGHNTEHNDLYHVWEFIATSNPGEYRIRNPKAKYVAAAPTKDDTRYSFTQWAYKAAAYKVVPLGEDSVYCNILNADSSAHNAMHAASWDGIVCWEPNDENSQFMLINADSAVAYFDYGKLLTDTKNGYLWGSTSHDVLKEKFDVGEDITFYPEAAMDGYELDSITISWGKNLEHTYRVANEKKEITIPGDYTYGNVCIRAHWQRKDVNAMVLIFEDDFLGEGQPDESVWNRCKRYNADWNRFCSISPKVVFMQDGFLHCLAIPNDGSSGEEGDMLTGGVQTQGNVKFTYGRVEGRIKSIGHTGNFPAFWMMPNESVYGGWPYSGEIDIWETIDGSSDSHHTVHTEWTYVLGKGGNSKAKWGIDCTQWHLYRMDWDETSITWYVDNNKVWTYSKSTDESVLEQGQWPFDQNFYLILNQSVGKGNWAKMCDPTFTYETLFDWVRVYQPAELVGVEDIESDKERIENPFEKGVFDLSGRKLKTQSLPKGCYVINGKKVIR